MGAQEGWYQMDAMTFEERARERAMRREARAAEECRALVDGMALAGLGLAAWAATWALAWAAAAGIL